MFTGIVEKTGKLKKSENTNGKIYFEIEALSFLSDVKIGDSIACDGVCLTVVKKSKNSFKVELMPETLKMTKFSKAHIGDRINLEKSLKIGDRLDGHYVMGHIDGVGKIKRVEKEGEYTNLFISVPKQIFKFMAFKGSLTVNGVSLTIARSEKYLVKVCLISHTLKITNLKNLKMNDLVNIEVDIIARYLDSLKNSL
jgi:riboflavin synthase